MLGAIIGDLAGSRFEWHNLKSKEFTLLSRKCYVTDDSIMSLAICDAILKSNKDYSKLGEFAVSSMHKIGRPYPNCGYGGAFLEWMYSDEPKPYGSYGNGAAMRVSGAGFAAKVLDEAKIIAREVTAVTHNHPEGLKGAEATAVAVFMAQNGSSKDEIFSYITQNYYDISFKLDDIREGNEFNATCQVTVPQAIEAFMEATSFEDAIRNAVSIGGDSDTIAAITGGIAEAYFGIPTDLRELALGFLDERLLPILKSFEEKYPPKILTKDLSRKTN